MHHKASTADGTDITPCLVRDLAQKESCRLMADATTAVNKFRLAGSLVADMMTAPVLDDFLTTVAYPHLVDFSGAQCRL